MEELDQYLGGWGPYQTRVFLLVVLPFVSIGMHTMVAVIIFHVPHHRCRLPEWPEDSYVLQNEDHRVAVNQTIPMEDSQQSSYSQCSIFSQWNHSSVSNHSQQQRQLQDCQAWVYDTSEVDTSLISQFDLVCDRNKVQAHLNMVFFVGNLLGALGAGYLCDWFGRKPILYISNIICLAVGVASAFPPNVEIFLIYRAIIGATGTAAYIAGFVLVMELVGPEKRTRAGSLLTISWLMGPFLLDALSFLVRQWHYVQLISVAPLVLCLAHWWLLPESPRWLLTKKKTKAAMTVLQKMATVNKTPFSPTADSMVQFQEEPKGDAGGTQVAMVVLELMKCPRMVVVTVIILFNWCVISMMYYGLSLNVGNLNGSLRVNFFLSSTVELIGYVLAWVLLDRLGRKRSHCCFILTAGLACLATILTVSLGGKEVQWVTTALAMVGKLGISASYSVIYIMTAEIFPTAIRNFSEGCGSSWAYIGGAVSPYVADVGLYIGGRLGRVVPLVVFGGLALLGGISALYLPETLHRALPDTLEDAVNLLKNLNDNKNRKKVESNEDEDVMDRSSLMSEATTAVLNSSAAGS